MEKVVVIGAGRSGRGYVGELYDLEGYEITYADIDQELVDRLNGQGYYTVFKIDEDGSEEVRKITGYRALHTIRDHKAYIDAIVEADYVSTATFPDGFDAISDDIVEALRERMKRGIKRPMAITVGANYVGVYDYYSKRIGDQLNEEEREYLNTYMPLVESIIRRASSYPTEEQKKVDELAIQGDCLNTLEVERNAFRFGEGHELPKFFKMVDNVKREMIIKIWIGNTLHCSYAYLGQYYHLHSSFEAAVNDYVSKCSYYACEEAYNAVAKQLGLPMPRPVKEWQGIWTYYRNPSLQDTVLRIGADPIRKLSRNERFIGPALMSLENGDVPVFICRNAAYGFVFANPEDPSACRLQEMIREQGIEKTIVDVCQLDLTQANDKVVYDLILQSYKEIISYNPTWYLFVEK